MTENSAMSQNWVGCTVRTPKDPGCAHVAPRPRARCAQAACMLRPGRAHAAPRPRARCTQAARTLRLGRSHAAPRPRARCAQAARTLRPGRAHAAPRPRARCAQAVRTLRPGRAHAVPRPRARYVLSACRGVLGAISWPPLAVSDAVLRVMSSPLGHDTKIVSRLKSLPRSLCIVSLVSQRSCRVSQGAGCRVAHCVVIQGRPPVMIQPIVSRHSSVARPCAGVATRPARRPMVSQPC